MEHDINFNHLLTVGFFATFRGLRRAIGILGLLGLIAAGILGLVARNPVQQVVANPNPVCNRDGYLPISAFLPPPNWGAWVKSVGAEHATFYVREFKGTGWCRVKQDNTLRIINDMYVYRWYEVPSQYGDQIQQLAPPPTNIRMIVAFAIGLFSAALLFCLWLPATIMAAFSRRLIRNAQEEIHG